MNRPAAKGFNHKGREGTLRKIFCSGLRVAVCSSSYFSASRRNYRNRGLAAFGALARNGECIKRSTNREHRMPTVSPLPVRRENASAQLHEVPLTTEGYSVLHQ